MIDNKKTIENKSDVEGDVLVKKSSLLDQMKIQKQTKRRKLLNIFVPIGVGLAAAGAGAGITYGIMHSQHSPSVNRDELLKKYVGIKILADTKISLWCSDGETSTENNVDLKYSKDGKKWIQVEMNKPIEFKDGEEIFFKGNNPNGFSFDDSKGIKVINQINLGNGFVSLGGNIMGLLWDGDETKTEFPVITQESKIISRGIQRLFMDNPAISSIEELKLPATKLTQKCYCDLFNGCSSLKTLPVLFPEKIDCSEAYYSCQKMFYNCTSLVDASKVVLNSDSIFKYCCQQMFYNCSALKTVNKNMLPTLNIDTACYMQMFENCLNLKSAPALPATTLVEECYFGMFRNCRSLTESSELKATELKQHCYFEMFKDCSSLSIIETNIADPVPTGGHKIFLCPTIPSGTAPVSDMFLRTKDKAFEHVSENKVYYWIEQ